MRQHRQQGIVLLGWLGMVVALLCAGCSDNGVKQPNDLASAWSAFEGGDYDDAIDAFHAAIAAEAADADACAGLGWAYAFKG